MDVNVSSQTIDLAKELLGSRFKMAANAETKSLRFAEGVAEARNRKMDAAVRYFDGGSREVRVMTVARDLTARASSSPAARSSVQLTAAVVIAFR